jgi:hypothetical protein
VRSQPPTTPAPTTDDPLVLNPGSVGCPSYDDPGNDPDVSEAGSPHARYAILDIDDEQVSAEVIAIAYDWKAAADHWEERPARMGTRPAHGMVYRGAEAIVTGKLVSFIAR